jgi:hypothetical protein
MNGIICEIDHKTASDFLLPKHYSGRVPSISFAFGWYIDSELKAVCSFGKPASSTLCFGICGKEHSSKVYELNRLCRTDDFSQQLSQLVGFCLRELSKKNLIIVSYSDTAMNHHGYIYQACNFIYTGITKQRLEFYNNGKHSRHGNQADTKRQVRSAKHRYVFFATKDKRLKKELIDKLNYPICEYPKGDNSNYNLGEILIPKVVDFSNKL